MIRSPSTLSFRRSTPWVAGCWGPKLSSISSSRWRRVSERPSSKDWAKGSVMMAPASASGPSPPRPSSPRGRGGRKAKTGRFPLSLWERGRGEGQPRRGVGKAASRRLLLGRLGRFPARAGAGHRSSALLVVLGVDRRAGVETFHGEVLAQRIAVEAFPEQDARH